LLKNNLFLLQTADSHQQIKDEAGSLSAAVLCSALVHSPRSRRAGDGEREPSSGPRAQAIRQPPKSRVNLSRGAGSLSALPHLALKGVRFISRN